MRFKNSFLYVQRKIDAILRKFREFCRAYVDNIVVFSRTLEKYLCHLHKIFKLLNKYNISLSSKKSFLDYSTVVLLSQKVNAFELTTTVDKLKTIAKLNFFYTLKNLEIYLDLTS